MRKSQLEQLIKEFTQEKLQGSLNIKAFTDAGVPSNVAQKAGQGVNKLKTAKASLSDVNLDRDEKEALAKVFVNLLKNDDPSKLTALFNNIKSFTVKSIDKG